MAYIAGDIFLRPPDEVTDTDAPDAPRNMTEFSSQTYKVCFKEESEGSLSLKLRTIEMDCK